MQVAAGSSVRGKFRLGEIEVDGRTGEVSRNGDRLRLPPKPFEVLLALAERPGELVSRGELQRRLWSDDTFVDFDNNLNSAIRTLRDALGDSAATPRFVETLPKRGYRLLVLPEPACETPATIPPPAPSWEAGHKRRVRPWWFLAAGLGVALFAVGSRERGAPAPAPIRLAVLPIAAENETSRELAASLSDQLIVELARRLPGDFVVIARSSSFALHGADRAPAAAAERLRADLLLRGSLDLENGRLRLVAELWRRSDGAVLWADTLDRDGQELFSVQDELAVAVGHALERRLSPRAATAPAPEAYEAFLRARYLLASNQPEAARAALTELERAVALAPGFAPAWAETAKAWQSLGRPPRETAEPARAAAERALAEDPQLADAHLRLGLLALYYDYDWARAVAELHRARALAPHSSEIEQALAGFYAAMGRHDEAQSAMARARELDPIAVTVAADAGWYRFVARDYRGTLQACDEALALDPEHSGAHFYRLLAHQALGDESNAARAAAAYWETQRSAFPASLTWTPLDGGLPRAQLASFARQSSARRLATAADRYVSPSLFALDRLALGDTAGALDLLERSYAERSGWLVPFLAVYPPLDQLRAEPRFVRLIERLALPATGGPG